MAPKVDYSELKRTIDALRDEIATVNQQQTELMKLLERVNQISLDNKERDKKAALLDDRISDLEQYSRINDVVITGIPIRPRSYARVLGSNNEGETAEEDIASTELQVAAFLQSKDIHLDCNYIEACHPLPRRKATDGSRGARNNDIPPAVIMRFTNRKHKIALLQQWKKLVGSDVYINEHLIKRNSDIAKKARELRKAKKIQQTWTRNCKIFIKLNGHSPEEAKVLVVRSLQDLAKYDV